jgi:multicomponent Na+:H+ antiporter subunit A
MTWVNDPNPALFVVIVAMLAPVATLVVGYWEPRRVSVVAVASSAAAFLAAIWGATTDSASWDAVWIDTWNVHFAITLDGLAQMYTLLATGIGLLVTLYAAGYMPIHRAHTGQKPLAEVRFYGFLHLFMASMVGLVMAQDLILIFVFWDLTAIASYFLIGYDTNEESARDAAMMALLVTVISAIGVLLGAVILWNEYATFSLPELIELAQPSAPVTWAVALILAGALAKSAQFPLHFWLPRAMTAPTPVSAYLHSAAMVAAGVFLVGRVYPLVALDDRLSTALVVIGGASMVVGGVVALTRDVLKQILAYSTISQYGYVVLMFGIGGEEGVIGATFYVIAHAIVKSALFMTAGTVTESTGSPSLDGIGGLGRRMPLLAVGSALASAGMMALPLTIGFFKDELFFAAAHREGLPMEVFAVVGAMLTFAYIGRFWVRIFLGPERGEVTRQTGLLTLPVVVLGLVALLGGIWVTPFASLAERAAEISLSAPASVHVAYPLSLTPEIVMALCVYALGAAVVLTERWWAPALREFVAIGDKIGPTQLYAITLHLLNRLSDSTHDFEVRDLRSRIATILIPAGVLVVLAVIVTPTEGTFVIGDLSNGELPVALMVFAAALSGIVVTIPRDHIRMALTLSCVGYSLAVVYAFIGAPDVALVAVLIETIFALVLIGILVLIPNPILRYERRFRATRLRTRRDAIIASIAGLLAFFVVWSALSRPSASTTVIDAQIEQTPLAHGKDIVTVILADFRGFDTMGEITVVAITLLGILSLMRAGRLR